jgi:hypothetical protein
VTLSPGSARAAGYAGAPSPTARYVRLRTISVSSTGSGAASPLSGPAIVPLDARAGAQLTLQVEAVNHTTYEFRYGAAAGGKLTQVGWGNSSEVRAPFFGLKLDACPFRPSCSWA